MLVKNLIFGQSYDDDPLPGYHQIFMDSGNCVESSLDDGGGGGGRRRGNAEESVLSDYTSANESSRKGHTCPTDDQFSKQSTLLMSSCNKCRPAVISSEPDSLTRRGRKSNTATPHPHPHPSSKGLGLSRLFPRLKKKNQSQSDEEVSRMLRKEVVEANERRDAALSEAAEMRSSLGELKNKLECLEMYCEELNKGLRQEGARVEISPNSEESMVEGFLEIVSEARSSVKKFCKLFLNSKQSKAVAYNVEAVMNLSLYQDFENCSFKKNGAPRHLDPRQERQARLQSFIQLRNLSWSQVLREGTKCYSEELSKFCDEKMSGLFAALGCRRPWPEQLLQAFFVAAKCVWLLHLLAFSFDRPLGILRVDENMVFDSHYMEDVFGDRQRSKGCCRVKMMVMPGFYVLDKVVRCKVLCR